MISPSIFSQRHFYNIFAISNLSLALALFAGCSGNDRGLQPVQGSITWEGKPVAQGQITFMPVSKGRMASSTIKNGVYKLTSYEPGDGAKIGEYQVVIDAYKHNISVAPPLTMEEEAELLKQGKQLPAVMGNNERLEVTWLVPEEYSQQNSSPLKASVAVGEQTIDFKLPN